jgi:signal transduction histidine kinase
MQERIRQLGGTVEITSSEKGTLVEVTLPRRQAIDTRSEGAA